MSSEVIKKSKTMFYEDNPLTVKYKEKIKESENSVNEIRETFL